MYKGLKIIIISLFSMYSLVAQESVLVESTFEDFRDGTFQSSGVDLYVTPEGTIKTINRRDLNGDGHLDLIFNSAHDFCYDVKPTLAVQPLQRTSALTESLPVDGARQIEVSDLNKDGYEDLIFLPNYNGVSNRRFLTILWGSEERWSGARSTKLLTISALKLVVSDVDGDGWKDLCVLNGTKWSPQDGSESVLRIYWGSHQGYQQNDYRDIIQEQAIDFEILDVTDNGKADLVFLLNKPGRLLFYHSFGKERDMELPIPQAVDLKSEQVGQLLFTDINVDGENDFLVSGGEQELVGSNPTTGEKQYRYTGIIVGYGDTAGHWKLEKLSTSASSDFLVRDLDLDSYPDIVLADRSAVDSSVVVFWGSEGGHFDAEQKSILLTGFGAALDVGDVDQDGVLDIVVAGGRTEKTHESAASIFYGLTGRKFKRSEYDIACSGASDIIIVPDTDLDRHFILIANSQSGRYFEDVPIKIYWGTGDGFDVEKVSEFPNRSGYNSGAADLNNDGYVDLVMLSIVHATRGDHETIGFNILWGGPDGLSNARRSNVNEYGVFGLSLADINRDGFLDIVGSVGYASPDGEPIGVVIWHGSKEGFLRENREMIPITQGRPTQHTLADFDRDGYLDVALLRGYKNEIEILWGDESGLDSSRTTSWPFLRGGDLNTADLNGDGWLDLIASSLLIPNTIFYDYGTYIFWGGASGFSPSNAQRLESRGTVGITIADWDDDGFLDIFLPSYHYTETRESVAAYLYWGSKDGYDQSRRTSLMQDGGHAAAAGDYNGDGLMDLAVSNHVKDGNHFTQSQVFYNNGERFKHAVPQELPTVGPHFMFNVDAGNQYDRTFVINYISSELPIVPGMRKGSIDIDGIFPGKSGIGLAIRFGLSKSALNDSQWVSLENPNHTFDIPEEGKYIQYRLSFSSANGDQYAEVDEVRLILNK